MSYKRQLLRAAFGTLRLALSRYKEPCRSNRAAELSDELCPIRTIETPRGSLRLRSPGEFALWRADHLLTAEPGTIAWLDSFSLGEVLWDIGANVGVYTLYAALQEGARVVAFEPAPVNYSCLARNVQLNAMTGSIQVFAVALNDKTELGVLNMSSTTPAGTINVFGAEQDSIDHGGRSYDFVCRPTVMAYAVDEFVDKFDPPFPNHVKLDVDGNEDRILSSAGKMLADERLRSILVEFDMNEKDRCERVRSMVEGVGFELAQLHAPPDGSGDPSIRNHVFRRS